MLVVPLMLPSMVKEPFDVVTVQSLVCADGLLNVAASTFIFDVILSFVVVCGKDERPAYVT